jgi:hypothetical protein
MAENDAPYDGADDESNPIVGLAKSYGNTTLDAEKKQEHDRETTANSRDARNVRSRYRDSPKGLAQVHIHQSPGGATDCSDYDYDQCHSNADPIAGEQRDCNGDGGAETRNRGEDSCADKDRQEPVGSLRNELMHQVKVDGWLSNAFVQLQAHLTMRAQRAIQKCLSAATFVR